MVRGSRICNRNARDRWDTWMGHMDGTYGWDTCVHGSEGLRKGCRCAHRNTARMPQPGTVAPGLQYLIEERRQLLLVERRETAQQNVQDNTHRPAIDSPTRVSLILQHFRRDVTRGPARSFHHVLGCERWRAATQGTPLGGARRVVACAAHRASTWGGCLGKLKG